MGVVKITGGKMRTGRNMARVLRDLIEKSIAFLLLKV
jgi:glycerol-3-phosphate dehydrogenase